MSGGRDAYAEALAALGSALKFGIHPSLDGIRRLTDALGRPQDALRVVQVTGTNGKSSVTRMTAALLRAHGCRSATYTSPHLVEYNERVELDGAAAPREAFGRAVLAAVSAAEALGGEFTEFELLTAAALWLMREQGIEWACLEVGLGGRWDATSVTSPAVAVVTGVGLDHTDRLGDTLDAIAFDKAHVIKPGSVAVLGPQTSPAAQVFDARIAEVGARAVRVLAPEAAADPTAFLPPLTRVQARGSYADYDVVVSAPSYQAPNVAVALSAAEAALGHALDLERTRRTLASMRFPGRFELLATNPPLVIDGAHNPQAAAVLAAAVAEVYRDAPPALVLGILADKDAEGIIAALAPVAATIVATAPASPRALSAEELAALVTRVSGRECRAVEGVADAVALARGLSPAGALVTGSLYTAGEARAAYPPE